MKLATLKNGSRDGQLVVVSRDLTYYTDASFLVPNLQAALDGWARIAPHLEAMAEGLEHGSVPSLRFHEHDADSPLPRAYQWAVVPAGSPASGAGPTIHQMASDVFLGPRDPIVWSDESDSLDIGSGVAVVVDDIPMGASEEEAQEAIQLVMLVNEVSDRESSLPAAFSPVAVTPDELGEAWDGGRVHLPLLLEVNGNPLGKIGSVLDFPAIIARVAKTRPLSAGTIIGSGMSENGAGKHVLRFGDQVRIEVKDGMGHSVFGAIEQSVELHNA